VGIGPIVGCLVFLVGRARRGVPRLDGARGKKQVLPPMLHPKAFREQMYCTEESTCDIVGTVRRPPVIQRPGHCGPIAALITPPARNTYCGLWGMHELICSKNYEKVYSLTVKKIIIWYINFCSYLIGSFQNFLEQISTLSFFKVLKLVWSVCLFTHQRLWRRHFGSRKRANDKLWSILYGGQQVFQQNRGIFARK